jgi:hypothetical protein
MRLRHGLLALTFGIVAMRPDKAFAGMPSPVLSDWAQVRIETLSFFVVVLLISAAVVRWLWNALAKDFPKMPRLGYRKSLAAVVLCGMLLAVVLTMIAGARELLTHGAWQKQGVLYKVPSSPAAPVEDGQLGRRKEHLQSLKTALWQYADTHEGRFPDEKDATAVAAALWEVPGGTGARYLYVPYLERHESPRVLVYEPELSDVDRLVLRTNGDIVSLPSAELREELQRKPLSETLP